MASETSTPDIRSSEQVNLWRFVWRKGAFLFAVPCILFALDAVQGNWLGWSALLKTVLLALAMGPGTAAAAYLIGTRSPWLRSLIGGALGAGLSMALFRQVIAHQWPVAVRMALLMALLVAWAVHDLPPGADESKTSTDES